MALPLFYFAWTDEGEPFNPAVHNRNDEQLVSFRGEHVEGEFGVLDVVVKNPLVPLLSPSRKVWAWFSWDNGDGVEPLFHGRLVGVPGDINKETVTLNLIARPSDFTVRKAALADQLKVPPYYDKIFFDPNADDPDAAWEGRTSLWHIDRVTHDVTDTDLLAGEDGTAVFLANEVPYDSVAIQIAQPPLRSVTVDATVSWQQSSRGQFTVFENSQFRTFGADKLADAWPKSGASFDGGWKVAYGAATHELDRYPDDAFQTRIQVDPPPKPLDSSVTTVEPVPPPPVSKIGQEVPEGWLLIMTNISGEATKDGTSSTAQGLVVPIARCWGTLKLEYAAARGRTDRVRFTLSADVQNLITMPDEQDVAFIEIQGGDVGAISDAASPASPVTPVIGDVQRATFFPTDRGQQAIQYLLMRARSLLANRARAIQVSWQCKFARAVALTGRMNAQLHDPRLPGGAALGKIVGYTYELADGQLIGGVTIGCAIGQGGSIAAVEGDPTYVTAGYVKRGYQRYENATVPVAGIVGYTPPANVATDDGLRFPLAALPWIAPPAIKLITYLDGVITGIDIEAWRYLFYSGEVKSWEDVAEHAAKVLEQAVPSITLQLKPVEGGPFENVYDLAVTDLKIPNMLNLG